VRGLALHTWTLDTTPLPAALAAARAGGWDAIELRWLDFDRARQAGGRDEDVLEAARACGLPVACVGTRHGWMLAEGAERDDRLRAAEDSCRRARALGCDLIMSAVDFAAGDVERAVASVREMGALVARHGVRLALEHQSQAPLFNTLGRVRDVLARAAHPACGLLVDSYHVQRSGDWAAFEALSGDEIFYVQYSDVPAETRRGFVLDRLPPGAGVVPFRDFFARLAAKGYRGWLSYEGPNEAAWKRPPADVAREAAAATRALLPGPGATAPGR
jgi:sugar phosphate isomerase/epimerase